MNKLGTLLEMIKFEHSVFALPFALAGAFLGASGTPGSADLFWIVAAMVGARSLAMTLNRLIDHEIDSRNPRTSSRALPAGLLRREEAWGFAAFSLGLLVLAVWQLHPLCRWLWPPVVALFVLYPYTKRFTWWSHFFLGLCLGLAPVGAWVAVTGTILSPVLLLGLAVTLWTAGFDIIYACQDLEADLREGTLSIPVRFGLANALSLSRVLHLASLFLLAATGAAFRLDLLYFSGLAVVGVLLLWEHRLVSPRDLSRLDMAFFTMNGVIAAVFLLFTVVDLSFGRAL